MKLVAPDSVVRLPSYDRTPPRAGRARPCCPTNTARNRGAGSGGIHPRRPRARWPRRRRRYELRRRALLLVLLVKPCRCPCHLLLAPEVVVKPVGVLARRRNLRLAAIPGSAPTFARIGSELYPLMHLLQLVQEGPVELLQLRRGISGVPVSRRKPRKLLAKNTSSVRSRTSDGRLRPMRESGVDSLIQKQSKSFPFPFIGS